MDDRGGHRVLWWAPDGFTAHVSKLDLTPGGELLYSMTGDRPRADSSSWKNAGMPLSTESHKRYTE